jgi:hypothetical protein
MAVCVSVRNKLLQLLHGDIAYELFILCANVYLNSLHFEITN